jgi:hypothetical protein
MTDKVEGIKPTIYLTIESEGLPDGASLVLGVGLRGVSSKLIRHLSVRTNNKTPHPVRLDFQADDQTDECR